MSDVYITLEETPVFVQIAPVPQLNVSVGSPSQVYIKPTQPVPVNVQLAVAVPIKVIVSPISGPVGPPGPVGPQGQRGSLLLGNYASFANLPPLINFLPGDYAIVNDTGEIFQITES